MTNLIAAIIITVSTNWVDIGTFTPKTGYQKTVEQGTLSTNTTAILEWKGQRHELLLESTPGPIVGERRVDGPGITNSSPAWKTWPWPIFTPGAVMQTNGSFRDDR